jgi:hypothetical protein
MASAMSIIAILAIVDRNIGPAEIDFGRILPSI